METIGQRVRAARERQGMTQAELARRIKASVNAINMLEIGSINDPKASRLLAIAETLGVTTDALLGRTELFESTTAVVSPRPTHRGRPRTRPLAATSITP